MNIYLKPKIFRALKLSILCLILGVEAGFATESYSQKTTFTISVQDQSVKEVFDYIEQHSEFIIFYLDETIDVNRKVSVNLKGQRVESILEQLFKNTDVTYTINDRQILLSKRKEVTEAAPVVAVVQQKKNTVTGVVLDPTGMPVIGANIMVKGTTSGTITDMDGKFSLDVDKDATLVVSYIGFANQEIKIGNQTNLSINLKEDAEALDELVVTALGIKREEKALGYSVQKVSGETLNAVKTVDVATSLTGKIAGLNVWNSTEFNKAPSLSLRGETPLLVVDGVPYANMSLRDIASDDIESIDVLKGATASALYGARGGSGAVMVTTKKGKVEGLQVQVNSSTMFNAGYLILPEVQTSYSTGQAGKYLAGSYVWGDKMDIGREALQYNPYTYEWEMQPLVSKGKDNLKNFQELSFVTNNNVSVTQKGKLGSFRTSLTHVYNKGQWPNEKLNKFTYTASGTMNVGKFKADAGVTYNKRFYPNMGGTGYGGSGYLYNLLIWSGADFDIRDYKNYWIPGKEGELSNWMDRSWYENPYLIANEVTSANDYNLVNAYIDASYDILPWLKANLRSGADYYGSKDEWKTPIGSTAGWGSKKGYYGIKESSGFSINNDLLLMAEKKLGDFNVDGFLGGSIYYWNTNSLTGETKNGIILPNYYSLNASVEPSTSSKSFSQKQVNSIYGKAAVSWRNAVFAEVTGRNDWSSTLPESTRSYFYPSVSGSIVLSEFIPMPSWTSFWKVRGSWTKTKYDVGVYDINKVYSITTNVWDDMTAAYNPTSLRSNDLLPSTSRTYEIGTALHFLQNRLRIDYAYYNKENYNNTRWATLSPTCGYTSTLVNYGETQVRKGHEITVSGDIIKNKDLTWTASFNWARDRYYYGDIDPVYSTQKPWVAKGERWDWISAYDYQRDSQGNIIHNSEGLPLINPYESIQGYTSPDWIWGLSTTLKWKNFTVDVTIDGRVGGLMFAQTDQALWNSGAHIDSDNQYRYEEVVNGNKTFIGTGVKLVSGSAEWDSFGNVISDDRVFAPNDIVVSYETYMTNMNPYVGTIRTQNLLDPTFIKLRNWAINYTLPKEWCKKICLQGLTVGIVGQNLLMWTKEFRFSDPDWGEDSINTPSTRLIGFNVKFDI